LRRGATEMGALGMAPLPATIDADPAGPLEHDTARA
jgi:hypothetical protein